MARNDKISDYHFARIYRLSALNSLMPIPKVIRVVLYMAKGTKRIPEVIRDMLYMAKGINLIPE